MSSALLPWHQEVWRQFRQLQDRMPHALLFYGPAGVGKTAFAEFVARSLLCEQPAADGQACGTCLSCGWFVQYSHPDYRRLRPEALDEGDGAESDDGESRESGETKKSAKSKVPSKEIKIDQVRALADFMNISTHRQGRRVVLLYPAEALNGAAANALLKTLEEPPPGTVILMVSNSVDRLLPTILSRCRKFSMAMPGQEEALAWLRAQGVADADAWLAEQGGAPISALAMAQSGAREALDEFLAHLARPGVDGAMKVAERLQKVPMADLVAWLQRWLHDVFSLKLTGRIRYYPKYSKEMAQLAARVDLPRLMRAIRSANDRRAIADHPLSARLVLEDMLLEYSTLFSTPS